MYFLFLIKKVQIAAFKHESYLPLVSDLKSAALAMDKTILESIQSKY